MKIVHLMTSTGGGAGRAGLNLHNGLREAGVDSRVVVATSGEGGEGVTVFDPPGGIVPVVARAVRRAVHRAEFRPYRRHLRAGGGMRWERFSGIRTGWGESVARAVAGADIVHLHWISDFVDPAGFFPSLPAHARVVWTLHDMWPFTGGCHFSAGCERFRVACGACPQWGSVKARDFSSRAWEVRKRAYGSIPAGALRLVAPSRWMADRARESSLLGGRETVVVANGIDLGSFRQVDRAVARRKLGLDEREFVALFLADSGGNRRKGLPVLEDALRGIERRDGRTLLVAGEFKSIAVDGWKVLPLGYVRGAGELSTVYSAADVFVHPALEDNLPSTVLESLACGTPVAGFRAGGIPEIIDNGEIGALCEPSAAGLRALLSDTSAWKSDDRRRFACRQRAEAYSIPAMVEGYRGIYALFGR